MKGNEMTEVAVEGFGSMLVEENEEPGKFQRKDLTAHRAVFDNLTPGVTGSLVVPTGEILTEGPHKGKGSIAMQHERSFRDVAKERGTGLQVSHTIMGDKTRLRLMTQPKREFTAEAMKKRTEALERTRAKKAGLSVEDYRKQQAAKKAAAAKATAPKATAKSA